MRLKSYEAGCHWLGIPESEIAVLGWTEPTKPFAATYRLPKDTGAKTALARILTRNFLQETALTLVVQEHGVWESGENPFLFTTFRDLAAGCAASGVDDAPFLLFEQGEAQLFESFFAITTYFLWDAVVLTADKKLLISTSHDEIFRIQSDDRALFEAITFVLKETNSASIVGIGESPLWR